jgi:hypothetical protein
VPARARSKAARDPGDRHITDSVLLELDWGVRRTALHDRATKGILSDGYAYIRLSLGDAGTCMDLTYSQARRPRAIPSGRPGCQMGR